MREYRPAVVAFFGLMCALVSASARAQDVELEVHRSGARKAPLAIAYFPEDGHRTGRFGLQLRQVLRDDLTYSGLFEVRKGQPPGGEDPLAAAKQAGLQIVVRGEYRFEGDEFVWEVRAYDAAYEKQLVGKRYRGNRDWWRLMAHAFADDLVLAYSGKRGIAHTRLAFLRYVGNAKELFLMDYDGHGMRQITQHNDLVVAPAWSRDGDHIFYTSYHRGNPDLYRDTLESGDEERIAHHNGLNTAVTVSPDNTGLALTLSRDGNAEIYTMNLATKQLHRLTHSSAVDTQPTWSPNGQAIAFVSDREGSPRIYVMDRDGADVRRITYGVGYTTSPVWSPQGDRIAFVAQVDGVFQLMSVTPQGTRMIQVTYGTANCEDPSWSPDGRHLAFSRMERGRDSEIWVIHADGTGARRVSPRGAPCSSPAWAPQQ